MKQTNKPLKALSLFSGIGGLDLAAMQCGIEPVAFCEIDDFPAAVLGKRFPSIPIYPDIRKLEGKQIGTVDVIYGGFPCQDLSQAGRKAGLVDDDGNVTRSGLWFEMLRLIREIRPNYVVAENVRGAVNAALDVVKSGLEEEGYQVWTLVIPASAFGAPHQRERLFIFGIRESITSNLTNTSRTGLEGSEQSERDFKTAWGAACQCSSPLWRTPDANCTRGAISEDKYLERERRGMPNALNYQVAHIERHWPTVTASSNERTGSTQYKPGSLHSANLGNVVAECGHRGQLNPAWVEELMGYPRGWTDLSCDTTEPWAGWPAAPGEPQYPYEHSRTITGMKDRAKRLKALGNSVVPVQALPFFKAIQWLEMILNGSSDSVD